MRKALSVNTLLVIFALCIAIPVVAAIGYSTYADWQSDMRSAREANSRTADIIASQIEHHIADTRFMLEQMAERPLLRALNPNSCDPAIYDFITLHKQFTTLFTIDSTGQLVCSTAPPETRLGTNFADRSWFQDVMATNSFALGEPQLGRLSNKMVTVFAMPIKDSSGRTAGVVSLSLDLIRFQEPFGTSSAPDGSVVRIVSREGVVVASSVAPEEWVGKNVADNATVKLMIAEESGQVKSAGFDGVERLQSFTTVPSANWRVWVGVPTETVYAAAFENAIRNGTIGALLLLAAVGLPLIAGGQLVRPVNRLAQAMKLAESRPKSTRAAVEGPAEIAGMAAAFNTMLDARNRVDEDLRQSEEVFKKAFQASPEALMIRRTSDNTVLDINPSFERITGFTRDEILENPDVFLQQIITPGYQSFVSTRLAQGEPVVDYEVRFRHKSGEIREALVTAEYVEIKGEQCLLVIGHDVTDVRQAERDRLTVEAAERANKAKSEFLSRMSHELRTPLNAVLGFTELLEMEDPTPRQLDNLQHIRNAGQHLLKLVNEVLDIARIEAQEINLTLEPVSVTEVMKECLDLLGPATQQHRVEASIAGEHGSEPEQPEADQWVLADRQKLRQSLLNLTSNAVKYNKEGGKVTLHAAHTGDGHVRISVTDTGHGIPADQMDRLFVPFERLGAGRRNIEGTGLGLALSRLLVEAMAGRIGVESKQNEGSTFWLELPEVVMEPRIIEASAHEPESTGPGDVGTRGEVLYIEDNVSNLRLVEGILRHRPGVKLLTATTGGEGFAMAQEHRPDLILLDLNLPDIHGAEVLKRLRLEEATEGIRVVVVSADANPGQKEHLHALGAYSYMTKPVDVQKLLALVDDLLAPVS